MWASLLLRAYAVGALACSAGTSQRSVIGSWDYREELRAGVYDERHKRWGLPFAKAASYTFRADGTYEFRRSLTSSTGTGNLEMTWSTTGSYVVRSEQLTLMPQRTVFASHSDIPDTPTGEEREPPGANVTFTVRFDGDSASCGLELPADRTGNRVFAFREATPLISR